MKSYILYCDGASRNNGKKNEDKEVLGSYGCVLLDETGKIIMKGGKTFRDVTNNQMELLGFIQPVSTIIKSNNIRKLHVVSDSQYLIKGITEWLYGWKKRFWKNSSGSSIKNLELWQIIDEILNSNSIEFTFEWVKGHTKKPEVSSNEYYNNMCDQLANESIDNYYENNKNISSFNENLILIKKILEDI